MLQRPSAKAGGLFMLYGLYRTLKRPGMYRCFCRKILSQRERHIKERLNCCRAVVEGGVRDCVKKGIAV